MTNMVKVLDILRDTTYSCDFGCLGDGDNPFTGEEWQEIIEEKSSDSGFDDLVSSYFKHGWTKGSEVGYSRGSIYEGHHRIVLAILLCLDEIPASTYGQRDGLNISAHHRAYEKVSYLV